MKISSLVVVAEFEKVIVPVPPSICIYLSVPSVTSAFATPPTSLYKLVTWVPVKTVLAKILSWSIWPGNTPFSFLFHLLPKYVSKVGVGLPFQ